MKNPKFVRATKWLLVLCLCMTSRIWLYRIYFQEYELEKQSSEVLAAVIGVSSAMLIVLVCFMSAIKRSTQKGTLMTRGPYRIVAHPLYAMYILLDIPLWFIMPFTAYLMISGILFYTVLVRTAYLEENYLISKFGDEAKIYYRRTPSVHMALWRLQR